jgi:hypothetical protein
MADFMVERHFSAAETDCAEPSSVLCFFSGGDVFGIAFDEGEGLSEGAYAVDGEELDYGVCVWCVECFDCGSSVSIYQGG